MAKWGSPPKTRLSAPAPSGLVRPRLQAALSGPEALKLVLAPAGSGKTTAVRHAVAERTGPLVWYRLGRGDDDPATLLHNIGLAAEPILDGAHEMDGARDLIALIDRLSTLDGALVLDEVEHLGHAGSDLILDEVFADLPHRSSTFLVGRERPQCNLSLLAVRGSLAEVGVDQLRFRLWEVDEVFSSTFGLSLLPRETAEVERRTRGWAAGLQLFYLATRGASPQAREATLRKIGGRHGPAQEFLATNVLDSLPTPLLEFLLECFVLPELQPSLCDRLRGATDSDTLLSEVERRQLFLSRNDSGTAFVLHDIIRNPLENRALDTYGETNLRARHEAAGDLLVEIGDVLAAGHAYICGQSWDKVAALADSHGPALAAKPTEWFGDRRQVLDVNEPWFDLAAARGAFWDGDLATATSLYQHVRTHGGDGAASTIARRELLYLKGFSLTNPPKVAKSWSAQLAGVVTGAITMPMDLDRGATAAEKLVDGLRLLLAGQPDVAASRWQSVVGITDDEAIEALALSGIELVHWLQGSTTTETDLGIVLVGRDDWPARLVTAIDGVIAGEATGAEVLVASSRRRNDALGVELGSLLMAMHSANPASTDRRHDAIEVGDALDAIGLWTAAFRLVGDAANIDFVAELSTLSRSAAVPWMSTIATETQPGDVLARRFGFDRFLPTPRTPSRPGIGSSSSSEGDRANDHSPRADTITVSCFGSLTIDAIGPISIENLRPRARDVLRLLALHSPEQVHRDALMAAFWTDDGEVAAKRKLQVAISAIRSLLDAHDIAQGNSSVHRDGESYSLTINDEGSDVTQLRVLCATARRTTGRLTPQEFEEFVRLVGDFGSGLLRECGSADWIVDQRVLLTNELRASTHLLAGFAQEDGSMENASLVCELMLDIDPLDLAVWERLSDVTKSHAPALSPSVEARRAAVVAKLHASTS